MSEPPTPAVLRQQPVLPEFPSSPGLWRTPGYRWLWIATLLLGTGYGVTLSSQASFWDETAFDSTTIAFVGLSNGIGILFGYLLAGLTADRRPKRSLVRIQVLATAGLSALTAVLALAIGLAGDWFFVLVVLFGVAHGAAFAVMLGWTAEILPRRLIAKGVIVVALAGYAQTLLTVVPGVSVRGEPSAVFWFFAVACLAYLLTALAVRKVPALTPVCADTSTIGELRLALRYLWGDVRLRSLCAYALGASAAMTFAEAAILHLLWVEHGFRSWDYTLPFIARGGAYFVSTLALVFLISSRHRWLLFVVAAVLLGIAVALLAASSVVATLTMLMALMGLASPIVLIGYRALGLSVTRSLFFGRVAALVLFADSLLDFAAGFLRVHLFDLFDGRIAGVTCGLFLTLLAFWFWTRWRRFRFLREDPDDADTDVPRNLLLNAVAPQKTARLD